MFLELCLGPHPLLFPQDKFPDTERLWVTQTAVAKQLTLLAFPHPQPLMK